MAFFSFAFMGSGPIGALVNGLVVERIGPEATLVVVNAAMLTLMLLVAWRSSLWHLEAPHPHR
jgi:predicted MFS family arabinose efflux permease